MYTSILKNYISRLNFISSKVNSSYSNLQVNILNSSPNQLEGTIIINPQTEEEEIIMFETKISKTEDMLIFKTKYQSQGKIHEEIDTFAITKIEHYGYSTSKTKILIHITNGEILKAYQVGKKYKFENGINDNLTTLNMNNKDVVNFINNISLNSRKR